MGTKNVAVTVNGLQDKALHNANENTDVLGYEKEDIFLPSEPVVIEPQEVLELKYI